MSDRPECTLVVCDDQAQFRELLSQILDLEGDIDVVGEAADGREAITVVRDLRPDIVLLDIAMPVMDGLAALPHIRAASPGSKVMMLSGVAAPTVQARAMEAGACAFIEKGLDLEVLIERIRTVCADAGGS